MESPLYQKEHTTCINYESSGKRSIEYLQFKKGMKLDEMLAENEIIFILEGRILFSYDQFINKEISKGKAFVLPPSCQYTAFIEEPTSALIFRPKGEIQFCDKIALRTLFSKEESFDYDFNLLPINRKLTVFLTTLVESLKDEIYCSHFFELKTKELFFMLRAYYPKRTLWEFFYPLLSENSSFTDFILKNYLKVKTVNEFAALSPYSVSGFEKEFRRVFNTSVYQWMTEKRVKLLYHEIKATDKPFKQITFEQGFSSLSQFNDYCKKHFAISPGKMRKGLIIE